MPRKLLAVALLWLVLAPVALARPTPIMPGITYESIAGRTSAGPLRSYVITAPKPGGLYSLTPLLSNGTITGRETVSSMERHVASQMTTIGVNGDFFNWLGGWPSGLLMQGGVLEHQSSVDRSSVGIDSSGNLHVDRVSFSAIWKGFSTLAYPISQLNEPPKGNSAALFTPVWGASTPPVNGVAVVLEPFPPATPFHDLVGTVTAIVSTSSVPIPRDGAVLVARGTAADAVRADALVGGQLTIRFTISSSWSSVTDAVGGGPALVKNGKPITNSGENLTNVQLYGHDPRTAIGQRADGGLVIVAADGRRRGWSAGISNLELAQALIKRGAVIGFALDSGGSTTVAFDGKLLNRPSDPSGQRPVGEALVIGYAGVYAPAPAPTLSPNGDRFGDRESLIYKIVRPSTVSAKLVSADGTVRELDAGSRQPGTYRVAWDGTDAAGAPAPEGKYRWNVTATDDLGRTATENRTFTVDKTLGFVRVGRNARTVRFTLTRPASIRVTVADRYIGTLRTFAKGRRGAGTITARWNGRDGRGKRVAPGWYTVHVTATSEIGASAVTLPVRIRR
jgi:exopolysaccharide biosynthesis protein